MKKVLNDDRFNLGIALVILALISAPWVDGSHGLIHDVFSCDRPASPYER